MVESRGVKILMYHWVSDDLGSRLRTWGVAPDPFRQQMEWLRENRFQTVTLSEVASAVRGARPVPERAVALTFDDGYRDFVDEVFPVLQACGFTATVFLVADRVGGTNAWDLHHGDSARPLLTWRDAAQLAERGVELGSHSRTHRMLPSLSDLELKEEIVGSKAILEDRLGLPVRHFSYPHGLFDARCLEYVAEAGYESACADLRGGNRPGTDPYRLRRSLITCHDSRWSYAFKLRTGFGMKEWIGEWSRAWVRDASAIARGAS